MQNTKPTVVVDDIPKTEIKVTPKSSCKHCKGRGYEGVDHHTRKKIVCRCVKRRFVAANLAANKAGQKLAPAAVTTQSGWDDPKPATGADLVSAVAAVATGQHSPTCECGKH
jgi:hypothetical protein